jgi:hypothetical protein
VLSEVLGRSLQWRELDLAQARAAGGAGAWRALNRGLGVERPIHRRKK